MEVPPSPKVQFQVGMEAMSIPVGINDARVPAQASWVLKSTGGLGLMVMLLTRVSEQPLPVKVIRVTS